MDQKLKAYILFRVWKNPLQEPEPIGVAVSPTLSHAVAMYYGMTKTKITDECLVMGMDSGPVVDMLDAIRDQAESGHLDIPEDRPCLLLGVSMPDLDE